MRRWNLRFSCIPKWKYLQSNIWCLHWFWARRWGLQFILISCSIHFCPGIMLPISFSQIEDLIYELYNFKGFTNSQSRADQTVPNSEQTNKCCTIFHRINPIDIVAEIADITSNWFLWCSTLFATLLGSALHGHELAGSFDISPSFWSITFIW